MTRYRLYRLAMISASFLGCAVLGAGTRTLGLHATLKLISFCVLGGAAVSAGWHGVRYLFVRHEEHLQDVRRHRAPRPDRVAPQPPDARDPEQEPAAADGDPEPELWQPAEPETPRDPAVRDAFLDFSERIDPYVRRPAPGWMSASEAAQYEDLYARHSPSGT